MNNATLSSVSGQAIRSMEYLRQVVSFANMPVMLSDLDAVVDFGGRGFLVVEFKRASAPVPTGQRRLFDALLAATRSDVLFVVAIASHSTNSANDVVDAATATIREYADNQTRNWVKPRSTMLLRDFVLWCKYRTGELV